MESEVTSIVVEVVDVVVVSESKDQKICSIALKEFKQVKHL